MSAVLTYLFWPNPGNASYDSPKALALLVFCIALIVGSFAIAAWRKKTANQVMRKLSKSWAGASFWFGLIGLVLVVSRVENIQFVAMRFLWLLWLVAAALYLFVQWRVYRARYYEVLPTHTIADPRAKYLPRQKRH